MEGSRHKLGMGKPLGLGSVRIDPLGLFFIDRRRRYSAEGFFAPRFHLRWAAAGAGTGTLGSRYEAEAACFAEAPAELSFPELRESFRRGMDPEIRRAVEWVGENTFSDISPPLVEGQDDAEQETYKWFVANDRTERQPLEPLDVWFVENPDPKDGHFPTLKRNPRIERQAGEQGRDRSGQSRSRPGRSDAPRPRRR
jgi:hypothetical protein